MGRKPRLDGRTINGVRKAIDAALKDEEADNKLLEMLNNSVTYSAMGTAINASRQRATYKVNRAVIRKLMLQEYREGRDIDLIARDWIKLLPTKTRKS